VVLIEEGIAMVSGVVCDRRDGPRLTSGQLALFPAGEHQGLVLERATGVVAEISGALLRDRSWIAGRLPRDLEPCLRAPFTDPLARQLLLTLSDAAQLRSSTRRTFEDALIFRLIERLHAIAPAAAVRGGLAPRQLRRVTEHIEETLDEDVALGVLAALVDLSASHLCRAFRASTGSTPHQWRTARRILRAKTLLSETATPLAEIALACGFSSQSHFGTVFAAQVGASPAAWRRQQCA
jgi:AraC-like DNA-binding protein